MVRVSKAGAARCTDLGFSRDRILGSQVGYRRLAVAGEGASRQTAALPLPPRQQAGPVPLCPELMF